MLLKIPSKFSEEVHAAYEIINIDDSNSDNIVEVPDKIASITDFIKVLIKKAKVAVVSGEP